MLSNSIKMKPGSLPRAASLYKEGVDLYGAGMTPNLPTPSETRSISSRRHFAEPPGDINGTDLSNSKRELRRFACEEGDRIKNMSEAMSASAGESYRNSTSSGKGTWSKLLCRYAEIAATLWFIVR